MCSNTVPQSLTHNYSSCKFSYLYGMNKKLFPKIICLALLLSGCNDTTKNDSAAEKQKPDANQPDTLICSALVEKQLILSDSIIALPKIKLSNKAIEQKINAHFTVENISGYSLQEVKEQKEKFKQDSLPFGLTDLTFDVNYNKDCLLSLTFAIGTCGAYPSSYSTYYNFDLTTGDSITNEKLLRPDKINELVQYCDKILQQRISDAKKQDNCDDMITEQLEGKKFTKESLANFFITEDDFVFVYFFGFPHVILGAEPDGQIKISKAEMKKYLRE